MLLDEWQRLNLCHRGERPEELGGQLCPTLTHHPLGVLGRAHFFEVVSDL